MSSAIYSDFDWSVSEEPAINTTLTPFLTLLLETEQKKFSPYNFAIPTVIDESLNNFSPFQFLK